MESKNIKNLAAAIMLQAAKDYVRASDESKRVILKDLRSSWMTMLTNGVSVVVAEQLELHPKEIAVRLRQEEKLENKTV